MRTSQSELHGWHLHRRVLAAVAAIGLVLAGSSTAEAASKTISEPSNGKVVSIKVGSTFSVVLNSTYWEFTPLAKTKAISEVAAPVAAPIMPTPGAPRGCGVPGSGCGTVTWKFKARAVGSAVIAASRSSCGEALQCSPENSAYSVRIKVTR